MELKDFKITKLNDDELLSAQHEIDSFIKFLENELGSAKKMEEEKS